MKLQIEPFAAQHVAAAARLEEQCFDAPWSEAALAEELDNEHALFLAAVDEESGQLAGYLGCHLVVDEGYIANVAVSPTFRRSGIGSALVCALIERAKERGASFLTLEVRVSNRAAIGLYEKLGFQSVGVRRGFYDKPKEDALLMTVHLPASEGRKNENLSH